jgi:hypothetical protein
VPTRPVMRPELVRINYRLLRDGGGGGGGAERPPWQRTRTQRHHASLTLPSLLSTPVYDKRSCPPPRLCFGGQCIWLNVPPPPNPNAPAPAPAPVPTPAPGTTVTVINGQRIISLQSDGGVPCNCLDGQSCLNTGQCCPTGQVCGDQCCTGVQSCFFRCARVCCCCRRLVFHARICVRPSFVCVSLCHLTHIFTHKHPACVVFRKQTQHNTRQRSQCCNIAAQCGNQCCPSGSLCVAGACCAEGQVCGGACCGAGTSCVNGRCCPTGSVCGAAGAQQTCCAAGSVCDPNSQTCCPSANFIPGVGCCDPANKCGGSCCAGGQRCLNGL